MAYQKENDPNLFNTGAPAKALASVTRSDTVDLPKYAKSLKCNAAGTISVLPVDNYRAGNETSYSLVVSAGEYVPIEVARVFLTGTSLADSEIVALLNG